MNHQKNQLQSMSSSNNNTHSSTPPETVSAYGSKPHLSHTHSSSSDK
jgi:hypothetical protein